MRGEAHATHLAFRDMARLYYKIDQHIGDSVQERSGAKLPENPVVRRGNNAMGPARKIPVGIECPSKTRKIGRSIESMLHGIFARPQELDRRPLHRFSDLNGLVDEIRL